MTLNLMKDINLDLIKSTADARGMDRWAFLEGIMDYLGATPGATQPKPAPFKHHQDEAAFATQQINTQPPELAIKAGALISGLKVGDVVNSLKLYFILTDGKMLKGMGARRAWSNFLAAHEGLERVYGKDKCVRIHERTAWGYAPLFRRVPMITDQRSAG